ncbi:biosynthetic arginine decarboxylase [Opitutaceae bacterium TAV4]|uniref:biosynthetic arginine decarboxylase n=1 Tax=Geminisphaera colitermitum TaxID=1148786 RepID=UPI000158CF21|nr:biosynthetic arginine decarboxylase [Geminisphaera colitermitum]RRJ96064.1 biosynthetic arginine decarboxylase [Opitutaceae bacterium TAV4]RRK00204.1 biosynthetic arginine decarboxylase [Opitutaceae bacterium TAV3]
MKRKVSSAPAAWSATQSEELYGFKRWGAGHFGVDPDGLVTVQPLADGRAIRITDVVQEALDMGLKAPMVIRFQDLLRHRVEQINRCFRDAIKEEGYKGDYRGVFPIKVNQLREVVDEIVDAGKDYGYGLEAGSKPELMIALAMHEGKDRLIICNGYKDLDYIRLALIGRKIGKKIIIVVEQLSEVDDIIAVAAEIGVKPMIGFRAKLQTRGEGKWSSSSGDNAKFGLNTAEILFACDKLRKAKLTTALRLVHFHIGSQVPNILTIKNAVIEASRFYCQLHKMGFPMGYLDVGGGLGIDYDGSRTNYESSMNYTMAEYARDVVANVRDICDTAGVPLPDLISESGRAVVAPHSMLVVEVFERINKRETLGRQHQPKEKHKIVTDLEALLRNRSKLGKLERFHDAVQAKDQAFSLFNLGYLDLENRAAAESIFWQICEQIAHELDDGGYIPEDLEQLKTLLADQYVCNFSVFQSLLDHWALKQLFPIAPLHRLTEKPTVNATLVDITCDSDGKINSFIDLQDTKDYLQLHPLNNKPYYLGVFLTGAYQDIMGDLHNLFGRVNEVHVFLEEDEPNGFYVEETIAGSRISDVIEGVQYQWEELCRRMKTQIDHATKRDLVKPREGVRMTEYYEEQMRSKTYLGITRPKPRPKLPRADAIAENGRRSRK